MPPEPRHACRAARSSTGRASTSPMSPTTPSTSSARFAEHGGFRSVLSVPMLREGRPIGAISSRGSSRAVLRRRRSRCSRPSPTRRSSPSRTCGCSPSSRRSNRELTEALEQQTATSEILRVISRSQTDVQPVFDTIVRQRGPPLCDAGWPRSRADRRPDGCTCQRSTPPAERCRTVRAMLSPPGPGQSERARTAVILERGGLSSSDADDPDVDRVHAQRSARVAAIRSLLAVPMLRDGEADRRDQRQPARSPAVHRRADRAAPDLRRPGGDRHRERAPVQGAAGADRSELTRSVEQLEALGEVGQAVSSTLDLETVLTTIVSRAVELSGLDGGVVFEYDEGAEEFVHGRRPRLAAPSPRRGAPPGSGRGKA